MPKVRLSNISLYYKVYGRGEPLLLIAGLGSDSSSWLTVIKELSDNFQVIIFDNRGCGRSDIGNKNFTISDMAEDAIRLLDYLKIKKANVLGHSMGGYIAQELAINHPARIIKLVLVSTALVSSKRNNVFFEDMYKQLKKEGYSNAWVKKWIVRLFSLRLIRDKSFVDTFVRNLVRYPYLQKVDGFKCQINAIVSFDARDRLSKIKAKTLILEGKNDILITPKESRALAKNIRGSTFRLLNGVAHCIHIENPKLFTDTALKFFGH